MLRAQEPSAKQKKYFGDSAFRPFAVINDVSTEQDIRNWLKRAIESRLDEKKVEDGKLMFVPDADSAMEYATLDGARISGRWHRLET